MGNSSYEVKDCSQNEYPGYDNQGSPECMQERWIVLSPDPDVRAIISPQMTKALMTTKKLLKNSQYPEIQSWWFLRWIYFDRFGSQKDISARLKFLHVYLKSKSLQGFLSHDEAIALAKQNRGRFVISLDETLSGNINFTMVTKEDEYHTSMKTIDETWTRDKKSLEQLTKEQCEVKTCNMFSRSNSKKNKK